jgi:ABC-type nitrate/sulfonate/bicarbonate transport system substrate-binding protein
MISKRLRLGALCLVVAFITTLTAAQAQPKLDTVTFGIQAWSPLFYVPMVGVEKGIFEKHGVKLDPVITQGSGPAIQAVLGGSINMAATTSGSAFLAQMQAPDLKQILGVVERSPYTLVVRPEIKSITDLKGKVLGGSGVRAGADTETMRLIFRGAGLQESDYTVIAAGSSTIRSQSLVKGTIQGLAQMEPYVTMLKDEGMVPLARAIDYPAARNLHLIIMVAMRPWYTQNEATVSKFFRAWAEAHAWLHDPKNKAEAIRIYSEKMKQSERHAAATYHSFVEEIKAFSPRGQMNIESVRLYGDAMRFLGHPVPADVDGFADLTPAKKAFGN